MVRISSRERKGVRSREDTLFITIVNEEKAMSLLVNGFISGVVKQLPLEYAGELNRLIEIDKVVGSVLSNRVGVLHLKEASRDV